LTTLSIATDWWPDQLPYPVGVTVSGWFADPGGKVNTFRWWDGEAWTRWLSADPSADTVEAHK
jgi:hypothetical protein